MQKLLGVDIGGSKISIILYQGKKILKKWRKEGSSLENLKEGLFLFPKLKVGIAFPGIFDKQKRKILKCSNLPFLEGLDLKKELKRDFVLENDAKCFILAERKFGALKGKKMA
ncbi:ROK family protein [Candidatus Parcubacteria bacterium]|nr:ROK family protein [Candidatus Parcubacteria bacterium]